MLIIDRSNRGWAVVTGVLLLISAVLYSVYANTWPNGPSGRTWPGMMFGVVGTLLMIFAGALSGRKQTVGVRFGSLAWWLKGHVWLGLLSVPMILFHAAFRLGGRVEIALWIILAVVIVSGIFGLALQNVIPRTMKLQLSKEFIPDQFGETCKRLILLADEKVTAVCTPAVVGAVVTGGSEGPASAEARPLDWLAGFHISTVRPFLGPGKIDGSPLATDEQAELVFDRVRTSLPDSCWPTVDWLAQACNDRRQLAQQEKLYRLLHGWLKIHIPCSIALTVFIVIHVVSALYY